MSQWMYLEDVDLKYRIPLAGIHNRGIYICPHCDYNMIGETNENAAGFSEALNGAVIIVECTNCFEKYYYHPHHSGYRSFLSTVRTGRSKFFDQEGNRKDRP